MTRGLLLLLMVACASPSAEVCDDHLPTETRSLEIGNIDRSVPLGTEFPFVPYEEGQVVVKEYGSQAATHLPIYLRVPVRAEDGDDLRCVWVHYARAEFETEFPLDLERRGGFWVTRIGFQDVAALGEVVVTAVLRDALFEASATIALDAVEPFEG